MEALEKLKLCKNAQAGELGREFVIRCCIFPDGSADLRFNTSAELQENLGKAAKSMQCDDCPFSEIESLIVRGSLETKVVPRRVKVGYIKRR